MRPSHFPLYLSFYHWIDYFLKFVDGLENAYYIFHFLFFTANSIPSFQGIGGSEWALERSDKCHLKRIWMHQPSCIKSRFFTRYTFAKKKNTDTSLLNLIERKSTKLFKKTNLKQCFVQWMLYEELWCLNWAEELCLKQL